MPVISYWEQVTYKWDDDDDDDDDDDICFILGQHRVWFL